MTLIERLLAEAHARRNRKTQAVLVLLLREAADALERARPKSIEENLEICRSWALPDEEVEELLK